MRYILKPYRKKCTRQWWILSAVGVSHNGYQQTMKQINYQHKISKSLNTGKTKKIIKTLKQLQKKTISLINFETTQDIVGLLFKANNIWKNNL